MCYSATTEDLADECIRQIRERVGDKKAYLTFDIDFIDPAYAPGTGTPEVGGFTGYQALKLVCGLKGLNIVGFDLVEVMPAFDNKSATTAMLAANVMYEFLSLMVVRNN